MKQFFFKVLLLSQLLGNLGDTTTTFTQSQCTGERNFVNVSSISPPPSEALQYLSANGILNQVIIIAEPFNCSGVITSWSGLTVAMNLPNFITLLPHVLNVTVWRPDGSGHYDFVGSNRLEFNPNELVGNTIEIDNTSGLITEKIIYFRFAKKEPMPEERIIFQRGDVVGWIVNPAGGNFGRLSLVFRNATNQNQDTVDIKKITYNSSICNTCSVSDCASSSATQTSVIPYLSFEYDTIIPDNFSDPVCGGRRETVPPDTTTTVSIPPPTSSASPGGPGVVLFAAPAASIIVVLLLLIIVAVVIICLGLRRRGTCLFKRRQEYQSNPTYASADDVVEMNECHQSKEIVSFENPDGAIYALPDVKSQDPDLKNARDLEDLFDGECYASTYQANNGQCHIYQELTETQQGANRSRSKSLVTSHELLKSGPPLPLRTISSASFAKFPYNTPAPSLETMTRSGFSKSSDIRSLRRPSAPYLESKPSLPRHPHLDSKSSFPYTESKSTSARHSYLESKHSSSTTMSFSNVESNNTSFMSLPYLEMKPSVVRTPEDTPPSSASGTSAGPTARKFFHAIDDEVLRVPNSMERQEFKTMSNTEEIYSKLKYPYLEKKRNSVDTVFLDQPDMYWAPSSSAMELYDQLAKRKFREIQRNHIHLTERIGEGHFGTVYKGMWTVPGGMIEVAVKTHNPESAEDNEVKFLKEAAIMGQFIHPNVIKLLGVVTLGEPLMIVLELMPRGDLKQYLRSFHQLSLPIPKDLPSRLLGFCRQIGFGMNYLMNKAFVHRDLAARNILLTEDLTCKIGDFGMARDLEEETVYFSQGGKMPLKWTAPEALKYHQFSSASDVWSYGMLLFEIWSLGKKPFEGIQTNRLMTLVYSGYCQPPPSGCPRAIYQLMVECWHTQPEKRITFPNICTYLKSPSEQLLSWSRSDMDVSPRASELGAPLSEARKLYTDLQFTHSASSV